MKRLILFLLLSFTTLHADNQTCDFLYNSSALDKIECGANLSLGGDFIYWIAQENGLYYAQPVQAFDHNPDAYLETMIGELQKVSPSYDPGFRLKAAYDFSYDDWNSKFFWTRYSTNKRDSYNDRAVTLWGHTSVQVAEFSRSSWAKWDLDYDEFDLDLGRKAFIGEYFALRAFLGLKGAIIDQVFDIFYDWLQFQDPPTGDHPQGSNTLKIISDFKGIGIKTGLDLDYNFTKNFGLFSLADFSILYGRFNCQFNVWQNKTLPVGVLQPDLLLADSSDKFHQTIANGHLILGLNWGTYFGNERTYLNVKLGWEQTIWYGVNKMRHHMHKLQDGKFRQQNLNLTLQGFLVSASLKF